MPKSALKKKCGNPNCSNPKCPFPHYESATPEIPPPAPLPPKKPIQAVRAIPPKKPIEATYVRDKNDTRDFLDLPSLSDEIKRAVKGPSRRREPTGDLLRTCVQCRSGFSITPGQQTWFHERRLDLPKRCTDCRNVNRVH
jgi:hypothetical protein